MWASPACALCSSTLRVIEACLQVGHDLVDTLPAAFLLPALNRRLATRDELGLHAAPSCGRDDRFLNELGQSLAIAQDSLDFGTDLRLDTDGWKSCGAHDPNV